MQNNTISIPYDHPGTSNQSTCSTAQAWAKAPRDPKPEEKAALIERIKRMLKEQDAVLVAHYYVNADLVMYQTLSIWRNLAVSNQPKH